MAADLYLVDACAQRAGRIVDHMSTANVARDLDLLREAVGDAKLTYFGVSYGTLLGRPTRTCSQGTLRAIVARRRPRPVRVGVNTASAIRSRRGCGAMRAHMATLNEFFRLCDTRRQPVRGRAALGAALRGHAAKAARRRAGDITFPDGLGFHATYANLIGATLGPMYDSLELGGLRRRPRVRRGEGARPRLCGAGCAACGVSRVAARLHHEARLPALLQLPEGFPAVACSDSDNPASYAGWHDAAVAANAQFGCFGPLWTWVTSICAKWGGADADRYTGPFNRATAAPRPRGRKPLRSRDEIRGRGDGAQPAPELGAPDRARLGHTSLFISHCADTVIARYLIGVATPAPGTVCEQDHVPFSP